MVLRILILLLFGDLLAAQVVKQFHVEYRKQPAGGYTAFLINRYKAAATAYIAQATYRAEGKQQPTAWGGDSYSYPEGGTEVPAGFESESNALPAGAVPLTSGVIAVIYEDGFSEGDENVVQMMLAGRRRSVEDINQLIPKLRQGLDKAAVLTVAAGLRSADIQEAAKLDDLITVPGVKHQYFMTAIPAWLLRERDQPAVALYQRWHDRLLASKPAL